MSRSNYIIAGSLIMLIDDDPMVLDSLAGLFRSKGAQVITALDSEEAYREIKNANPDIIICDYKLSNDMDGGELLNDLSFIKKNSPVCILMTGDPSLKNSDIDDIAVSLLKKPFSLDELFDVVSDARKSLDYLKEVINIDAYRFKELELTLKIAHQSVVGEFVEAKTNSVVVSVANIVAKQDPCQVLIKNFLNNSQLEYLIEGDVLNVAEQDGYFWVEIQIKESFMINWKKLYSLLEKKQNEIMDFIKKANG
jgi:DNA-binding response OmpR family regulator